MSCIYNLTAERGFWDKERYVCIIQYFYGITKKNERPMGHISHLRKISNQWTQWARYDYIKREKTLSPFCQKWMVLICYTLNSLTQGWCVLSLVKIGPVVLEKRFFNYVNVFSLFRCYLLLENGVVFIWTSLNPIHPKMLCAKFGWNFGKWFLRRYFKFRQCIFASL